MSIRRLLIEREVAAMLGIPAHQLYRRMKALRTEHGFPGPVEGLGKRWDSRAIELWLDRQLASPGSPASPTGEPLRAKGAPASAGRAAGPEQRAYGVQPEAGASEQGASNTTESLLKARAQALAASAGRHH